MEGCILSFLKAEWKVSDTGSAHWASSLFQDHDEPILNHLQDVKVQFSSTQDMVSLFYASIIVTDCHIDE